MLANFATPAQSVLAHANVSIGLGLAKQKSKKLGLFGKLHIILAKSKTKQKLSKKALLLETEWPVQPPATEQKKRVAIKDELVARKDELF